MSDIPFHDFVSSHGAPTASSAALCPACGRPSLLEILGNVGIDRRAKVMGKPTGHVFAYKCVACEALILAHRSYIPQATEESQVCSVLWPRRILPDKAPPDLDDDHAKRYYDQARTVIDDSPAAAAALSRRVLQHVLRTKMKITVKGGRLKDEIDEALKSNLLTAATKDALHEVREIGNWAAHPAEDMAGYLIDVTGAEAGFTLDVLELVFQDLYVTPKRLAEMKEAVGERRAGQSPTSAPT